MREDIDTPEILKTGTCHESYAGFRMEAFWMLGVFQKRFVDDDIPILRSGRIAIDHLFAYFIKKMGEAVISDNSERPFPFLIFQPLCNAAQIRKL